MLAIGEIIDGKYRIDSTLGEGGMGRVYGGVHLRIRRRVAIKVLKAMHADDEGIVIRFKREALAASAVHSPHVVEIFDVGQLKSGEHYIIMERLDGESLSQRLRHRGQLAPSEAFAMAAQLLAGLDVAHRQGIVHRDLKPANVFLAHTTHGEVVKVLDFGVSKFTELSPEGFTHTGAIVGTPHYMAPEQTMGARHVDHRCDLYAVGAILFRCLVGRTPFRADTIHELIAKLIIESAPAILTMAPTLDPVAAEIVDCALRSDPGQRYQDARAMLVAIDAWRLTAGRDGHAALPVVHDGPVTSGYPTPHSHDSDRRLERTQDTGLMLTPTGMLRSEPPIYSAYGNPGALARTASFTPSPSAFDSLAGAPRRRSVGWLVAGAAATVAGAAVAAAVLTAREAPPAVADGAPSAPSSDGGVTPEPLPSPAEPVVDEARPGASVAPSASASAAGPLPRAPAARQPAPRAPAPSGPAPGGPAPADSRDFRTDI
jgi:serine/threonine-protein kinase